MRWREAVVEVYREFCGMFALLHCVYRSASGQSVFPVNADHADEQYNLVGAMSLVLELPCGRSKSIPPIDQDEGARLCNAPTRRPWQQVAIQACTSTSTSTSQSCLPGLAAFDIVLRGECLFSVILLLADFVQKWVEGVEGVAAGHREQEGHVR